MTTTPAPVGTIQVAPRRAWIAFAVVLLGSAMSLIDATIVNVALPSIRTSIDASEATLSWIISGYALAFGLALIPAGRLGDRFGHKWVFFSGLALFVAASVACGLSQTDEQLIVSRVVQGLAGGIYLPAVSAYIQLLFSGRVRGRAFAVFGAVLGVSSAIGPVLGGLLIEAFGTTDGWRFVFYVNLPIGVVALLATAALVPNSPRQAAAANGVDLVGLLLLSGALSAILVPLIEGQDQGWPLWTYFSLAGGVVLLVLFGLWERSVVARGRTALVPPHLFTHPAFTAGTFLALVYFAAFVSIFFSISLLWQSGLGHTALESGLVSIPFAIGSIVGSSFSTRLSAAIGRTVLILGSGLVALGLIGVWLVLLLVPATDLTSWDLLGPLLVAGLGSGLFIAPNVQFIVATVDAAEAGAASGVISTMQRIGSAIGIAVIGSVFFGTLSFPSGRRPTSTDVADAFATSATAALLVSAAFAVVAFLLVFTLPKQVGRGGSAPQQQAASEPAAAGR
ncbi:MFS transporter [uncultured Amnibacterium sp.]|uniref:MFS transporter n=1 Tax=uncultured Amnibacterium sp. TaxID=1631851 RepID=UPI0035C9D2FE